MCNHIFSVVKTLMFEGGWVPTCFVCHDPCTYIIFSLIAMPEISGNPQSYLSGAQIVLFVPALLQAHNLTLV